MKRIWYIFSIGYLLFLVGSCETKQVNSNTAGGSAPMVVEPLLAEAPSAPPYIEIHHIGAGDGDGTLFIAIDSVGENIAGEAIWDTCVVLIDAQRKKGGREVWRYVKDTISERFPTRKKIDFIIVTHLHSDHFQGMTVVLDSAKANGWKIGKAIDRQNANYKYPLKSPAVGCYDSLNANDPTSTSFFRYRKALDSNGLLPTVPVKPGNDIFNHLGFTTISFSCAVANGLTYDAVGDSLFSFLPSSVIGGVRYFTPRNENDLSIGFFIEFQGFHYLTLGDLGGTGGGGYVDGETPTTRWLKEVSGSADYHMCGLKASHHGSAHSSTKWFADTNNPTVTVFEASLRRYGASPNPLPTRTAIKNMSGTGANDLHFTFVPLNPSDSASYWTRDQLNLYNDVVIKVSGRPGYGDITMGIIEAQKSKQFVYNGTRTYSEKICTKGHDWE